MSAFDADTKWGKAVSTADEAVKKNGATLDQNTAKGQANRDALKGLVDAAQQSADAHARNGEGIDKVSQVMEQGRQKVIAYAKAMGMSDSDATAFADSVGLSSGRVKDLVAQIDKANAKPLKIKDEASAVLDKVKAKAKALDDGKTIQIKGDNKDFLNKVAKVNGVKINTKTGTLDLNKKQFDIALALANGAEIQPKTGELKANTHRQGLCGQHACRADEDHQLRTQLHRQVHQYRQLSQPIAWNARRASYGHRRTRGGAWYRDKRRCGGKAEQRRVRHQGVAGPGPRSAVL